MSLQTVASQFLTTIENSITSNRNSLANLSPTEISHRAAFIDALESCAKLFNTVATPFLNSTPVSSVVENVIENVIEPAITDIISSDSPSSSDVQG